MQLDWICGSVVSAYFPLFFSFVAFWREKVLYDLATSESIGDLIEKTNRRFNFTVNHPVFSTSRVDNLLLLSDVEKADGNLLENFALQKYFGTSATWMLEGDEFCAWEKDDGSCFHSFVLSWNSNFSFCRKTWSQLLCFGAALIQLHERRF